MWVQCSGEDLWKVHQRVLLHSSTPKMHENNLSAGSFTAYLLPTCIEQENSCFFIFIINSNESTTFHLVLEVCFCLQCQDAADEIEQNYVSSRCRRMHREQSQDRMIKHIQGT